MKRIFQILVVSSIILHIIWFFLPSFWVYIYNKEELSLLSWHGYGSNIDTYGSIPYLGLLGYMVASIGLIFFKKWARTAFLLLTIINIILTSIGGFSVSPAIDGATSYLVSISDGAILTIAYLTSINTNFSSHKVQ